MEKRLGKIKKVNFGFNDYMFGLHFEFGGDGWSVMCSYDYNPSYKGGGVNTYLIKMIEDIQKILKDAKVDTVDKLLNKPIECTFDGNLLKDFRILIEVL